MNGAPVKNLKEVVAAVEACDTPFLRMDLDYNQVPPTLKIDHWDLNSRVI